VHQYEVSSLRSPGGFPVTLDATFGARYTVELDGARVTRDLGPVGIRFSRAYPVQQVQTVLVGS